MCADHLVSGLQAWRITRGERPWREPCGAPHPGLRPDWQRCARCCPASVTAHRSCPACGRLARPGSRAPGRLATDGFRGMASSPGGPRGAPLDGWVQCGPPAASGGKCTVRLVEVNEPHKNGWCIH